MFFSKEMSTVSYPHFVSERINTYVKQEQRRYIYIDVQKYFTLITDLLVLKIKTVISYMSRKFKAFLQINYTKKHV